MGERSAGAAGRWRSAEQGAPTKPPFLHESYKAGEPSEQAQQRAEPERSPSDRALCWRAQARSCASVCLQTSPGQEVAGCSVVLRCFLQELLHCLHLCPRWGGRDITSSDSGCRGAMHRFADPWDPTSQELLAAGRGTSTAPLKLGRPSTKRFTSKHQMPP